MSQNANVKKSSGGSILSSLFPVLLIVAALVTAFFIFNYVLGSPDNFENGDPNGHPKVGNYLGMMYKGGFMVAILMACFMITAGIVIERFLTLTIAGGKGNANIFVRKVKDLIKVGNIDGAIAECDKQKGSVANVIREALSRYKIVDKDTRLDRDQKVAAVQKEVEESTSLELPMLEKNLVILSTMASVATLLGLLGTVTGMIRAFSAIATAGAPDAVALSSGISEALINTALGIGTSAIAVILYNVFTTKIDKMTYSIDEAGYSIAQNFALN
ncbi:MAG: MotA/TolQ/ExbB proton channel family protein [Chitinophagales bacterium]|nr:MotA/TolQ/ExbB proton channel family protein [Chitinophagales bacterium]